MNQENAKRIGVKKAFKSVTIALVVAYLIMVLFSAGDFLWILDFNYKINILIGILIVYGLAYFFGGKAGYEILIKKKDSEKIGAKYAIIILMITAFLVGWTGFLQEGMEINDTFWDSFEDYIFKPLFWIIAFGIIPTIIIGIFFGNSIKRNS